MKSIKILAVAALCTLAFSCNKKEETASSAENLDSAQAKTVVDALSQHETPEESEMLKEAQSKPLTTIAFSETDTTLATSKKAKKSVYEVINTGTNPLIISNVKPGCGCTVQIIQRADLTRKVKSLYTSILQTSTDQSINS
jgi:hypothetical protein